MLHTWIPKKYLRSIYPSTSWAPSNKKKHACDFESSITNLQSRKRKFDGRKCYCNEWFSEKCSHQRHFCSMMIATLEVFFLLLQKSTLDFSRMWTTFFIGSFPSEIRKRFYSHFLLEKNAFQIWWGYHSKNCIKQ